MFQISLHCSKWHISQTMVNHGKSNCTVIQHGIVMVNCDIRWCNMIYRVHLCEKKNIFITGIPLITLQTHSVVYTFFNVLPFRYLQETCFIRLSSLVFTLNTWATHDTIKDCTPRQRFPKIKLICVKNGSLLIQCPY